MVATSGVTAVPLFGRNTYNSTVRMSLRRTGNTDCRERCTNNHDNRCTQGRPRRGIVRCRRGAVRMSMTVVRRSDEHKARYEMMHKACFVELARKFHAEGILKVRGRSIATHGGSGVTRHGRMEHTKMNGGLLHLVNSTPHTSPFSRALIMMSHTTLVQVFVRVISSMCHAPEWLSVLSSTLTLLSLASLPIFHFFFLNLDFYFFLFHVDAFGARSPVHFAQRGVWSFGQ